MWEEGHDPMTQHRHWFPFCPFVLGQNVGNIPLGEETGPQNIPEKEDQAEEDRETVTNTEAGGHQEAEETDKDEIAGASHKAVR